VAKDDYVYLTNSGKVYTLTGTRLDRLTGKPIPGAPRLANPPNKGRNTNDSNSTRKRSTHKGDDKYTAKVNYLEAKDFEASYFIAPSNEDNSISSSLCSRGVN
jgi:hypothetical protein